jgi:hypothetical protein
MIQSSELSYGQIRYFSATRCFNTEKVKGWNQNKFSAEELVSFDCALFDLDELESLEQRFPAGTKQIMAIIIRPGKEPNWHLRNKTDFVFCGYDLVEELSGISAITGCGGSFLSIRYETLTEYGLIPTYKEAVWAQLALMEEDPHDPHADCEIVEIWRKLI